jgi:Ca-activated chloride channel family protein
VGNAQQAAVGRPVAAALLSAFVISAAIGAAARQAPAAQSQAPDQQGFRFRSGVELINVTATVTDASGRFVSGLRQEDFAVFEDNEPQTITHFSADRVPVSLGILLDTSQSMQGEKFEAARGALDRFLADLSSPDDEFFLMQFSSMPTLLQGWTGDRQRISRSLVGVSPRGGTAMYDAIADSVPLYAQARNRKQAIVIISDGNDMTSDTSVADVHKIIRESEALVYAVGIDCSGVPTFRRQRPLMQRPFPRPFPFPTPGRRPGWPPQFPPQPPGRGDFLRCNDPVDVMALRDLTDDSGGRTEIVRDARDLNPATEGIADELSKQYYLGYPSLGKKDGRWHSIRVEVRHQTYRVRARRGYIAS